MLLRIFRFMQQSPPMKQIRFLRASFMSEFLSTLNFKDRYREFVPKTKVFGILLLKYHSAVFIEFFVFINLIPKTYQDFKPF